MSFDTLVISFRNDQHSGRAGGCFSLYDSSIVDILLIFNEEIRMSTEPNVQITFRHVDSSNLIRDHVMGQLEKVISFLSHEQPPVRIEVVIEPSRVHAHHKVELIVSSPQFHKIISYERPGMELYELIDRTIDIMYRELHEAKRERVTKLRETPPLHDLELPDEEEGE
jgi:ribosome-associated translation inhibitor RaiA